MDTENSRKHWRRYGAALKAQIVAECGEPGASVAIIEAKQAFDGHNRETWPAMVEWLADHIQRMERVFAPEIAGLRALVRSAPLRDGEEPTEPLAGNGTQTT